MINFDKLDKNGFVKEGSYVTADDAIIGKVGEETNLEGKKVNTISGKCVKFSTSGYVDKVVVTKTAENLRRARVRIRKNKIPTVGDKYASRPGQKGMCGLVLEQEEMPFTKDGIVPDLIINPHALPSRMTIGQLVECVMGKACALRGGFGDCTAFMNKGSKHQVFGEVLTELGYSSSGNEMLYNGMTGDLMESEIFIGPTYYMRLKHMVKDKINFRARGPRTVLTRQTVQGRANDGGLRIGEMERDGVIGHGATKFLEESLMVRGDEYYMAICNKTAFGILILFLI